MSATDGPADGDSSCPSFNELRRDGLEMERWNLLHPAQAPRKSYVDECLGTRQGPIIAATDYMRAFADQIRPFVPRHYVCLGTDGFGRSDYRVALRKFFEVDRHYVALAALKALADEEVLPKTKVEAAMTKYGIDAEKPAPWKM